MDDLQELGINAVWLMPFFPSPLRHDGYDIADCFSVHSSYGSNRDVRQEHLPASGRTTVSANPWPLPVLPVSAATNLISSWQENDGT
jgi:hypothetical protein